MKNISNKRVCSVPIKQILNSIEDDSILLYTTKTFKVYDYNQLSAVTSLRFGLIGIIDGDKYFKTDSADSSMLRKFKELYSYTIISKTFNYARNINLGAAGIVVKEESGKTKILPSNLVDSVETHTADSYFASIKRYKFYLPMITAPNWAIELSTDKVIYNKIPEEFKCNFNPIADKIHDTGYFAIVWKYMDRLNKTIGFYFESTDIPVIELSKIYEGPRGFGFFTGNGDLLSASNYEDILSMQKLYEV